MRDCFGKPKGKVYQVIEYGRELDTLYNREKRTFLNFKSALILKEKLEKSELLTFKNKEKCDKCPINTCEVFSPEILLATEKYCCKNNILKNESCDGDEYFFCTNRVDCYKDKPSSYTIKEVNVYS